MKPSGPKYNCVVEKTDSEKAGTLQKEAGLEVSFLSFQDELFSWYHMSHSLRDALKLAHLQTSTVLSTLTKNSKRIEVRITEIVFLTRLPCG